MSNLEYSNLHGGGTITSWTVTPSLPIGLSLDSNGVISGTPTVVTPSTVYTITGSNTGGSDSTTVTIQVNDKAPLFYYSFAQVEMTKGISQSYSPTVLSSGGAVVSFSVSPSLPNGLTLMPQQEKLVELQQRLRLQQHILSLE